MFESITDLAMYTLALAQVQPVPDEIADAVQVKSLWDFVQKGGVMMIPIGICSFVALAVFIERMLSLRRNSVIPPKFLPGLKRTLKENPDDREKGLAYCRKNRSPVSNVFAAGIKRIGSSTENVQQHIEEAGAREVVKLRRYLRVLSVIASIAPLLGLLGTIFGMIKAFQKVALAGEALGKTEVLAEGIYEAMITTAAGLIVAIPVLIAYHVVSARIDRLVMDIDEMSLDFIEDLAEGRLGAVESEIQVASDKKPAVGDGKVQVATT